MNGDTRNRDISTIKEVVGFVVHSFSLSLWVLWVVVLLVRLLLVLVLYLSVGLPIEYQSLLLALFRLSVIAYVISCPRPRPRLSPPLSSPLSPQNHPPITPNHHQTSNPAANRPKTPMPKFKNNLTAPPVWALVRVLEKTLLNPMSELLKQFEELTFLRRWSFGATNVMSTHE